MNNALLDFVEDIGQAQSSEVAAQRFIDFASRCGANVINMFMGPDYADQYASNLPDWFVAEQFEALNLHDAHMVKAVRQGVSRTFWGIDIDATHPSTNADGIACSRTRFDLFGQRSSVTFALPDDDGGHSGAGIGIGFTDKGDVFLKRMDESGGAFAVSAFAVHAQIQKLKRQKPKTSPLSPRQAEILKLLAAGYRVGEIADRLAISDSAVNLYLANLKTKLGVRTKEQALAMALSNKWIEI